MECFASRRTGPKHVAFASPTQMKLRPHEGDTKRGQTDCMTIAPSDDTFFDEDGDLPPGKQDSPINLELPVEDDDDE